jgi:hypothetical protein
MMSRRSVVQPIQRSERSIYWPIGLKELDAFPDRELDIGANAYQFDPIAGGKQGGLGD